MIESTPHGILTAITSPDQAATFARAISTCVSHRGVTLDALSRQRPTIVLFMRHLGCTFCREALAELQQRIDSLRAQNIGVAIVHMDEPLRATTLVSRYGLTEVHRFSDPECKLYDAFELERGSLIQVLGPDVWWKGFFTAIVRGHGFGPVRGDVFRMPGLFLIENGEIVVEQRASSPYAIPDFDQIASNINACPSPGTPSTPDAEPPQADCLKQ